ncbi:hypothetical protein E2C01_041601 [Portunus trituberculatus]|uniref:Uncharacterized protein n=1 Tax=Portunus trituberculatus TaxID=210409 RepID=A0A5B7FS49_PORTR|nr:hypothetical protein [Portunus trituberculatus]
MEGGERSKGFGGGEDWLWGQRPPWDKGCILMVPVRPQPAEQCTSTGRVSEAWQSLTSLTMSSRGRTVSGTP